MVIFFLGHIFDKLFKSRKYFKFCESEFHFAILMRDVQVTNRYGDSYRVNLDTYFLSKTQPEYGSKIWISRVDNTVIKMNDCKNTGKIYEIDNLPSGMEFVLYG